MEMSNAPDSYYGVALLKSGRYEVAIQLFSNDIIMGRRSVWAYCYLGLARFKLAQQRPVGKVEEAFWAQDPRVWDCPAGLYLWDTGFDQPLEFLNDFLRLHPVDAEAYAFRGNIFDSKGHLEKAIADYNEAIRLNPNYADAYSKRSQAYLLLDEHQRAADDASEAIRLDPRLPLAYINRAYAYAALGRDGVERDIAQARKLGLDCTMDLEY